MIDVQHPLIKKQLSFFPFDVIGHFHIFRFDLGFGGFDGRGVGWVFNWYENTQDWSIDKPKKADFENDLNCMIECVKKQPHLLFLI